MTLKYMFNCHRFAQCIHLFYDQSGFKNIAKITFYQKIMNVIRVWKVLNLCKLILYACVCVCGKVSNNLDTNYK